MKSTPLTGAELVEVMNEAANVTLQAARALNPRAGSISIGDPKGEAIVILVWNKERARALEGVLSSEAVPASSRNNLIDTLHERIAELEAQLAAVTKLQA